MDVLWCVLDLQPEWNKCDVHNFRTAGALYSALDCQDVGRWRSDFMKSFCLRTDASSSVGLLRFAESIERRPCRCGAFRRDPYRSIF